MIRRYRFLLILPFICFSLFSQPLKVVYMAQAGYDPRDVELRGREYTAQTGNAVSFRFEEYEDIYELVTGDAGRSGEIDIVLLDNIWTADFADRNLLEPVPPKVRARIEDKIIPEIYSANVYKQKMWGIPFLANFQLLYTNMDLLQKAGFDRPPVTLEEMFFMAETARKKGVIEYPFFDSLRKEEVLVCEFVWLSAAFGNKWNPSNSLLINNPENRRALEFLSGLKQEKLLNPYSLNSGELFAADVFTWGDALFTTNWTFLTGRLMDKDISDSGAPEFRFTVSVLPYSGSYSRKSSTISGFQGLAVLSASEQKETAWDFIQFLSSPAFQRRYMDEFPVWQEIWEEQNIVRDDPFFAVKREQVRGAKGRPLHPRYQEISSILQDGVYGVLTGDLSVSEALTGMQNKIDGLDL